MKSEQIEAWYIKNHGELSKLETITDVMAKGKTLIYGESGVGKTYSTISHLNRHKIKPLLIDFDNNFKIDKLDFSFVDGAVFVKEFGDAILNNNDDEKIAIKQQVYDLIAKYYEMYKKSANLSVKTHNSNVPPKNTLEAMLKKYEELNVKYSEFSKRMIDIDNSEIDSIFKIQNETVIIDTCAKAKVHFKEFSSFENFINMLIQLNNNVILIAHTNRVGNKLIPDIDEVFANHCDCKLKLSRDITKTKGEEIYLTVEKLRGYKGKVIIKDWER